MTKHTIIMQEETNPPFELKLNITDSELVVVENTAVWDTSAVILKVKLFWVFKFCFGWGRAFFYAPSRSQSNPSPLLEENQLADCEIFI